jgi:hypothetical protein
MISRPAAFSALALLEMAMVWLGLIRFSRSAIRDMAASEKCGVACTRTGKNASGANEQKFFASFFQERSLLF